MEKFRVYVIPASHTSKCIDNPNERPKTRVLRTLLGAQLVLGFSPSVSEAFLVESRLGQYDSPGEFYNAVKTATSNLGVYCVDNLLEEIDAEGKWDITRLVIDKTNPIHYP